MSNTKNVWFIGTLSLSVIFFFLHHICSISLFAAMHQLSASVLYPVLRMQKMVVDPIKNWSEQRAQVHELHTMIDALRAEQDDLRAENIKLQTTVARYKETQDLVEFNKRYTDAGYIAQVLLRHHTNREHFFLMHGGLAQGITKDMVAVYKNNLIGRVVEVYPWYCKVQLITDPACQVAAYCTRTRAQGIHKGICSEDASVLDYVSHLERLHVGDLVVSSGEGLVFPQGFALGKIASYVTHDLYQQITVKPTIDFRSINYCMLIAKK